MKCHKEIISISETSLISELSGPCRFLWHWDYALPSLCLESSTPFHCLCRKSSISIVLQVSNPLCSQEWNMPQVVYVHHYFLPEILNTFCFFMSMLAFTCLNFFSNLTCGPIRSFRLHTLVCSEVAQHMFLLFLFIFCGIKVKCWEVL